MNPQADSRRQRAYCKCEACSGVGRDWDRGLPILSRLWEKQFSTPARLCVARGKESKRENLIQGETDRGRAEPCTAGLSPAPSIKAALRCRARPRNSGQPCQRPGFARLELGKGEKRRGGAGVRRDCRWKVAATAARAELPVDNACVVDSRPPRQQGAAPFFRS